MKIKVNVDIEIGAKEYLCGNCNYLLPGYCLCILFNKGLGKNGEGYCRCFECKKLQDGR